jgi:hypothetical protein
MTATITYTDGLTLPELTGSEDGGATTRFSTGRLDVHAYVLVQRLPCGGAVKSEPKHTGRGAFVRLRPRRAAAERAYARSSCASGVVAQSSSARPLLLRKAPLAKGLSSSMISPRPLASVSRSLLISTLR